MILAYSVILCDSVNIKIEMCVLTLENVLRADQESGYFDYRLLTMTACRQC